MTSLNDLYTHTPRVHESKPTWRMTFRLLRVFCRARASPWTVNFTRTNGIPSLSQRHLSADENKNEILIPEYKPRVGEEVEVKRARLLYQSRCEFTLCSKVVWLSLYALYLLLYVCACV